MRLPTGTVTHVFTDIEGSTRLLRDIGRDVYVRALSDHRRLVRMTLGARGGVEVEMQGDGFHFAFADARHAVDAARELQDALAAHGWEVEPVRVRIGVHTGTPVIHEGLYAGLDVHRAARVMGAGHGGQILVTGETAVLVDVPLHDLGSHRLKDLETPLRLFQVGFEAFPPVRSLDARPNNLPAQPNRLVGREDDLAEIAHRLRNGTRLLTLTGPGGTGKTRLALHAAAELLGEYEHGAFFVPLAPLRNHELLVWTIAQTLGLRPQVGRSVEDAVGEYLRERRLLLVLDNLEQIVDAGPSLARLLEQAGGLAMLATSREALRIGAEATYAVSGLDRAGDAVELFLDRARAVAPTFSPGPDDLAVIERICGRLDRLPLALELAAARIAVLSPRALAGRLNRSLELLTSGTRDAEERQRTLRGTIQWSYDLLSVEDAATFRALACFAGGARLDAAQAVCDASLDSLGSLVAKSLLRRSDDDDGEPRFWFLETIREFARELLDRADVREAQYARHASYYLALAREAEAELWAVDQARWFDLLEADHDNLRAALDWSLESGSLELALGLATALTGFWEARGHAVEGQARFDAALTRAAPTHDLAWADALHASSRLVGLVHGDLARERTLLEEAIELYRRHDARSKLAYALSHLAVNTALGDDVPPDAAALGDEAVELARRAADPWVLGLALNNRAVVATLQGAHATALELVEESLVVRRKLREPRGIATSLTTLGEAALGDLQFERAARAFDEALVLAREVSHAPLIAYSLAMTAILELERGDLARASSVLSDALAEPLSDDLVNASVCLHAAAGLAAGKGDATRAVRLDAAAIELGAGSGVARWPVVQEVRRRYVESALEALGDGGAASETARGAALTLPEAIAEAHAAVDAR